MEKNNILENQKISWIETLKVIEKDTKKGRLRIGGTALKESKSRNGKNYTVENCKENNGKDVVVFVEHNYDNGPVGKTQLSFDEKTKTLTHDTWIKNTHKYPDLVENVADGLYKVSIGGNGKLIREKDGYSVKDLDIREMSIVGLEGIDGAGIDYAIAESFRKHDLKESKHTKKTNKIQEVDKMEKDKKLLKENEELKEKIALREKQDKVDLIESIVEVNESLRKDELMEKSDSELKVIKEYETKLKEKGSKIDLVDSIVKLNESLKKEELMEKSDEDLKSIKEEEEKKKEEEGDGEGNGEVADEKGDEASEEEKDEEEKEFEKEIVVNEKAATISMSEKARVKFNEDIKKSIYR